MYADKNEHFHVCMTFLYICTCFFVLDVYIYAIIEAYVTTYSAKHVKYEFMFTI